MVRLWWGVGGREAPRWHMQYVQYTPSHHVLHTACLQHLRGPRLPSSHPPIPPTHTPRFPPPQAGGGCALTAAAARALDELLLSGRAGAHGTAVVARGELSIALAPLLPRLAAVGWHGTGVRVGGCVRVGGSQGTRLQGGGGRVGWGRQAPGGCNRLYGGSPAHGVAAKNLPVPPCQVGRRQVRCSCGPLRPLLFSGRPARWARTCERTCRASSGGADNSTIGMP